MSRPPRQLQGKVTSSEESCISTRTILTSITNAAFFFFFFFFFLNPSLLSFRARPYVRLYIRVHYS